MNEESSLDQTERIDFYRPRVQIKTRGILADVYYLTQSGLNSLLSHDLNKRGKRNIAFRETETNEVTRPITKDTDNPVNQSKLDVIICPRC